MQKATNMENSDLEKIRMASNCRDKGRFLVRHIFGRVRLNEALKCFLLSAEWGLDYSQLIMGAVYEIGVGDFQQDFKEAVKWYRLAAEQGQRRAQLRLIDAYESGWGRQFVSKQEAEQWKEASLENNQPERHYTPGSPEYDIGCLCHNDDQLEEGCEWHRHAAELGLVEAQRALALAYECGEGVEEDIEEAIEWYRRAVDQGNIDAYHDLAGAYHQKGDYSEAIKWYRYAANQGHANSQLSLGCHYYDGDGVQKDSKEAVKWFDLLAKQGDQCGYYWLGVCYEEGEGVLQDFVKAYAWFNLLVAENPEEFKAREKRNSLFGKMTVAQVAEGQRLSQSLIDTIHSETPCEFDVDLSHTESGNIKDLLPKESISFYNEVSLSQGTADWLEWRNDGIGASDAPTIMGENPWKKPSALMDEKLGLGKPFTGNAATRRGVALEPIARKQYEEDNSIEVEPLCLQSAKYPWLRASLDGISADHQHVVEIKCGESVYKKTASTRKVPQYYMGQLQHILAITGLPSIDFYCYLPDRNPVCLNVPRDDVYISKLIATEEEFWEKVLEKRC